MRTFSCQIYSIFIIYALQILRTYSQSSVESQLDEQNIVYTVKQGDIYVNSQEFQQNITLYTKDGIINQRIYFQNIERLTFNSILLQNSNFNCLVKSVFDYKEGFLNFINIKNLIINQLHIDQIFTNITLIKLQSSNSFQIFESQVFQSKFLQTNQNVEVAFLDLSDTSNININQFHIDSLESNSTFFKANNITTTNILDFQIKQSMIAASLLNLNTQESYFNGFRLDKATLHNLKFSLILYGSGRCSLKNMIIPFDANQLIVNRLQPSDDQRGQNQLNGVEEQLLYYNENQISLIEIHESSKSQSTTLLIINSYFNFEFMIMRLVSFQNEGIIHLEGSELLNMTALDNGGAIQFGLFGHFELLGSKLQNCRSQGYGGAIFGGVPVTLDNSTVSNCKSKIGGAFFLHYQCGILIDGVPPDLILEGNEAVAYPNYFCCIKETQFNQCGLFEFSSIYQLNRDLENTPLYMIQDQIVILSSSIQMMLQRGFIYLIKLDVIEKKNIVNIPQDVVFGNMYQYLLPENQNFYLNLAIQGINFPYLITQYHSQLDCSNNYRALLYQLSILQERPIPDYAIGCFKVQNECINGQQPSLSTTYEENYPLCSYCPEGQYSYDNLSRCQACQYTKLDRCYANSTEVKLNFWRSKYSNSNDQVYECILSQYNCQGGNRFGEGNDLCIEGFVGVMCLGCDTHAQFWDTTYGSNGAYSCVACSSLENNSLVIYILCFIFFCLLMITLQSNYQRMKNQVYRKCLSQLGIIYIGSSFVSQSLGSVYMKLLVFNFQIYTASRVFTFQQQSSSSFSLQNIIPSFLNPTNVFGYSFDCFIINYRGEIQDDGDDQYYIGYLKLLIIVLIPIFVSFSILIGLLGLFAFKKFRKRYILSILFHAYFYVTMFQIQPQLIQYSIESLQMVQLPGNNNDDDDNCFNLFDSSIRCSNTLVLSKMKIMSIFSIICYTILTPLITLIFVLLLRKKHNQIIFRFTLGFLTDEYKPKFFYWEFIRIFLLISLSLLISLLKSLPLIMGLLYSSILAIYLYQIHLWHPYQQNRINKIEQKSVIVSMIYFLAALSYNIANKTSDTQIMSSFGTTFTKIIYYSANVFQILFMIWVVVLIFFSYFQLALRKLQRYSLANRLSRIFPYILTKMYSQKLIENLRTFRKKVREMKYSEYQYILKDIDCNNMSVSLSSKKSQSDNISSNTYEQDKLN